MRDLTQLEAGNPARVPRRIQPPDFWKTYPGYQKDAGRFLVASCIDREDMVVIATSGRAPDGVGWDHVSVSRQKRAPYWQELEQVKRTFFEDDETAIQFHVPEADHVNCHPNCLHLWRPWPPVQLPRPPANWVGPETRKLEGETEWIRERRRAATFAGL